MEVAALSSLSLRPPSPAAICTFRFATLGPDRCTLAATDRLERCTPKALPPPPPAGSSSPLVPRFLSDSSVALLSTVLRRATDDPREPKDSCSPEMALDEPPYPPPPSSPPPPLVSDVRLTLEALMFWLKGDSSIDAAVIVGTRFIRLAAADFGRCMDPPPVPAPTGASPIPSSRMLWMMAMRALEEWSVPPPPPIEAFRDKDRV